MSLLGFKSPVYHGDIWLGELDIVPMKDQNFQFPNNEIRIHHISPISDRCPPLSILQTISSFSVRCKLEYSSPLEQKQLIDLHASCFHELKTAVVLLGDEEIHLVAMPSKQQKFPCFWCCAVPAGLYNSCSRMLNMRCLAIVFDLDETLIVANTMKSFEDRIEALRGWIARETDPMRLTGMSAEMRRYMEDRALLKQYTENNCVVDNGRVFKVQLEEVPPLPDGHGKIVRPVIRLPERGIVLTRINPEIRDTSVLVKLRSAWEDLRSYLTAKGRKRFEVYVCTMAERDYALEMWRLLDPEANLINSNKLMDRIVCVKSGSRKSLLNVFQDGTCHPKMAMVIDDRSKVWEDKDQPRVHVVPAFTPYYSPQAETANAVPVLCVARNVACNVRGYFFKEFDEILLRRISEVFYEDEVINLPPAPDVSSFLMSEDASFVPNGNGNAPISDGVNGPEVDWRLNPLDEKCIMAPLTQSMTNNPELRPETSQPAVAVSPNVVGTASSTALFPCQKPSLLGPLIKETDNETKRRLSAMKHGVDLRSQSSGQPPLLSRLPARVSSSNQPHKSRLEEDASRAQLNNRPSGFVQESKPRIPQNPFGSSAASTSIGFSLNVSQVKGEEAGAGHEVPKQGLPQASQLSEVGVTHNHVSTNHREVQNEAVKSNISLSHSSIGVLLEIGRRCSSKVEFRTVLSTSKDLEFTVEVLFTGENIGVGTGKTRKDAQQQAAEHALHSLAEKYAAYIKPQSGAVDKDFNKLSSGNENGFLWDTVNPGSYEHDGSLDEGTPEGMWAEQFPNERLSGYLEKEHSFLKFARHQDVRARTLKGELNWLHVHQCRLYRLLSLLV